MISHRLLRALCNRKIPKLTCVSVRHHNFDGETYSKSNLSLITKEDDTQNYIAAYNSYGFRLTSGFHILGPCALFPRAVLHWSVPSADKITPASLSLFCMLYPKLDILILGKGDWDAKVDKSIIKYLRSNRINVEILPTEQACSTFNFLNSEHRVVAAALIPPLQMDMPVADQYVLHDEHSPIPSDNETLDNFPAVTETMESFQKHGVMHTIAENERKTRPRSSGPFASKDKHDKKSEE
ncbi:NADH dehydrogenase [ubiquinone] 1 alpha subcomplex assembly factor 3 [Elysia marginata]|uniref:NADH dehydrogenase [ubiquinone] 1 alpha subcomplex assembly factor 3 n=1 Tax=Elysia marginata TaxID=1093978 RepID=A0AAV4FSP9_9GAST|nr:NADH dehydrogenase [ubiquinone] 1 alpha subcomplex assembly factor 3 [Elysia marginata]